MSLENEDTALDDAIRASLQDGSVPSLPPGGCVDDDSQRQRSDSASMSHYTDSIRVMQEQEYQEALDQDRRKEQALEKEKRRVQEEEDAVRKKEDDHKQMIQELSDSLPPEPAVGSPGVAALMIRLPDGQRCTRRFLRHISSRWCKLS